MRRATPARRGGPGRVPAGPGRGRRRRRPPALPPQPGRACPPAACSPGQRVAAAHAGEANGPRPARPRRRRRRHAAPGPSPHPPALPQDRAAHTTGFTHSADGREDSPGEVAATIFASPAVGSGARLPHPPPLYYDRRPRAGGAAGRPAHPAKGLGEGHEARPGGGGRPHPPGLARGREVARRRGSGGGGSTSKDHVGE